MMNDNETTVRELSDAVIGLCVSKGWGGSTGLQNPQHVAMAMSVEMGELLENFMWLNPPDVERLVRGDDPERAARAAEEFADVMMYGLQLMRCLNVDTAAQIERKIGIVTNRRPGEKAGDTIPHT